MVVEQGEQCEYLADAVEDLWERVLMKVGEETGRCPADYSCIGSVYLRLTIIVEGLKVGEPMPIPVEESAFERVESGETLVVSER